MANRQAEASDSTRLMVQIATWFYLDGWSQVRIARRLGLDPSTVSRYLRRAREAGYVQVAIREPALESVEISRAIADKFGISRAVVAFGGEDPLRSAGRAAAQYLDQLLRTGLRLGVSWGQTIHSVVSQLTPRTVSGLTLAQLSGGLSAESFGIQGHDLVRMLATLYPDSAARYLHAPAIVDTAEARDVLVSQKTIRLGLEAAAASDVALVGIGSVGIESTLARGGHVEEEDRLELVRAGAVGSVNSRFFNDLGGPVPTLEDRTIAITWDELRSIQTVMAVAVGRSKIRAIAAALRTQRIDILITDDHTASGLLELGSASRTRRAGGRRDHR